MFWAFVIIEIAIVVVLIGVGFVTPFDIKDDKSWKQWLQVWGGVLMLAAILPDRSGSWRFHPKMFLVGTLIFGATFITWKRKQSGEDRD